MIGLLGSIANWKTGKAEPVTAQFLPVVAFLG